MVLFRRLLGDALRAQRMRRGMTLREVSAEARVSLGYISEIERGQKEASSELLASLCAALDLPLSVVLREVSDLVALEESLAATDAPVGRDVVLQLAEPLRAVPGRLREHLDSVRFGDVIAVEPDEAGWRLIREPP